MRGPSGPQVNRITPAMGAQHMQTYAITRPKTTSYWAPATCEQIECAPWLHGWVTTIDERSDLGQSQARYIRRSSGRKFTEERQPDGLTAFTFEAGQQCFAYATHERAVEREPLYVVRGGDWRGNPRGVKTRFHANGRDWVDDFGDHQQTLADRLAQG